MMHEMHEDDGSAAPMATPPAFQPKMVLLSERRAADLLGIDRATLKRAALAGRVPHFLDPNGRRAYDVSVLRTYWRPAPVPQLSALPANFAAPGSGDPER
jgi:hypothetical protein